MPEATKKVRVPWAVRQQVAEALHPGDVESILKANRRLICWAVHRYCSKWTARMGDEETIAEAYLGAMKGVIAWLLKNGTNDPTVGNVSTYIVHGIRYHFASTVFRWWHREQPRGVRLNVKEHGAIRGGTDAIDAFDSVRVNASAVLEAVERIDTKGTYRKLLNMRFGLAGQEPMSFSDMAEELGVSKQAVQARMERLFTRIREDMKPQRV